MRESLGRSGGHTPVGERLLSTHRAQGLTPNNIQNNRAGGKLHSRRQGAGAAAQQLREHGTH